MEAFAILKPKMLLSSFRVYRVLGGTILAYVPLLDFLCHNLVQFHYHCYLPQ